MKCEVNVNLDNYEHYPVIKKLADKYGASSTQFMNIFQAIMSESSDGVYTPSDGFIAWCKSNHEFKIDFISTDENHIKEIIDLGNEYYAYRSGDANLTAREEFINTTVSRFGYSSAKARDDAKLSCIKIILDIHRNSMYNVDRQNTLGIKDRCDRAILLAYEIIDSSLLTDEEKTVIKAEIQNPSVTTEEQVRRILHNNDLPSKFDVYGKNRKYYSRELRKAIRGILVQRAMDYSGLSQNEVMSILASNDNLANRLFPVNSKSEDERNKGLNLLALHEEGSRVRFVNKNDKNDVIGLAEYKTKSNRNDYVQDESFYDDLLKNSKLEFLRNESKSEFNDEDDILAVNVIETEETDDDTSNETPVDDDVDVSISLYEHMGTYKSAMLHCSKDILQYLNSLPVLNSPDINDEDRSNAVGLPISMNANFCATMLNHWSDKSSPDKFHDSIKRLASMPGCGGLIVLYDAMNKDYNLKYLFYSTFGKTLMPKSEVRQDGDKRKTVISNLKSIKSEAFKQELLNSIRSSIPTIDISIVDKLYKEIESDKFKMVNDPDTIKSVISEIYKIFRLYYPCINEDELSHYVYNHKSIDGKLKINDNLQQLHSILTDTIKASRETIENYDNMIANIREAYHENREKNKDSEAVLPGFGSNKKVKDIDISDYYYDYLTNKQKTQVMSLADILVDHVIIKVENNSISPLGNQSSDIINSNYITAMMKVLQDNAILEKYGKFKFQSRQYDFSNILFEHKDEKGVVINYGLFTRDLNGDIKPTSYANKLLSIHMYNGAKNYNEDTGLTYAMHAKGDYIAAAYTMFHNPAEGAIKGASAIDVQLAEYLMRTPADAQHNFTVTAPKYSTANLFKISNPNVLDEQKSTLKNSILSRIQDNTIKKAEQSTYNIRQLYNHLTSDKFTLKLTSYKENGTQSITLAYKVPDDKNNKDNYIKYTVTGVVKEGVLYYDSTDNNCSIAIASNNVNHEQLAETIITHFDPLITNKLEKEGKFTYTVNTKHPILKQLSQNFEQELLDMAIAIDTFFETTDDGLIQFEGNTPKFKNVKAGEIADGRQIDGAYDNYHFKTTTDEKGVKHGYLIEQTNGDITKPVYKLTGNVFKSDKFTVWGVDENGEETTINYGQRIVDELYDLLYGGAKDEKGNARYIQTVKENGNLKVVLNDDQRKVINKHISDYLLALTKDASERLYEFEHLMQDGVELNNTNIADFIINYHLAYNNFNDLFEGDSKFYKDSRTFLKRAKEVQGSGVPYGIANFLNVFDTERREITDAYIPQFAKGYEVKMYNKFRGATIVNTVTHNENTLKTIKDKLKEAGLNDDAAETIIDGHRDATVNDAQSYISFDEWIRRVTARGQLDKYRPLINKIINGEKLNGSELTEFVQVQKNFYYAQDFDTRSRLFAPNQIKNAEFVLIPQLIEGTQLELVAKLMDKYGIDQLNTEETSKAGKTNTLTIFNPKTGELLPDIIEEMTGDGSTVSEFGKTIGLENGRGIKLYSYEFLYTQQETPQHLDAKNKAGIQIMKKIIDNLPNDTKSELGILKKRFIDAYCNNIKTSAFELFKELGLPIDEKTGNLKLTKNTVDNFNFEVFYDKLRHELFRLGYDSNMIDYITLDENQVMKNGDITLMPNYMTMVGQKLENIAQSVFNNSITRQKLPGFHAAQITNVGLKAYGEGKENIGVCKDLKYHVDDNGNYVDYIEIKLPKSAFHFKRTNKDGSLKDDQTLLDELKDEGLDYVIGYRIPTEGKQSICKMKIVGFIDDAFGSTIVVPNEWVSQTGSDFDIDSVYGIQHATYIDKKTGKIRKCGDKSKYKNTNTIVDCMLDILGHSACLEENVSQSNFRAITGAINEISEFGTARKVAERRKNRSVFNILDQCDYQEDAMSGAKLKGFSVTRDNFCSVCNAVKPYVNPTQAITVVYDKNRIDMNGLTDRFSDNIVNIDDNIVTITHNTFGWSADNKNILGQLITTYSSQTTAHILDAIKEGAVPNVNDYTFGVYKIFPDMGIDYTTCISFMMQKGVSRIIRAYNDSKSIFTHEYSTPIETAIRSIGKELGLPVYNHTSIEDVIKLINDHPSAAEYREKHNIKKFNINAKFPFNATRQIEALSNSNSDTSLFDELVSIIQFKQLKEFADEIGAIARVCNPDKFGAKQSIFATNKVFEDIYELLESSINPLYIADKHILEAIYPGINNDGKTIEEKIANYISNSNDEDSKYKILHTFLKYSTAPSIIINRKLFKTQSTEFRNYLKGFEKYLNNGKRLTEKQNKLLERYIIGELYTKADCLTLPVVYTSNKRRKVNVWDFPEIFDTKEDNVLYEISRIFGYRKSSEPQRERRVKKINAETNEETEIIQIVPFYIDDIINPTEEDLKAFSQLTPAQKVHFIQTNFSNGGISKYLNVNLFNVKSVTGKATGTQTIEFIEDSIHPEDAYIQLQSDFTNRNPLIAMTAYDIIKYAFIVEGYKMSKRGVSKMIPNTLLYTKLGVAGIGLVEELNKHFRHLEEVMKTANTNTNDVYLDFIRSNYKQLNIPLRTVEKQSPTKLDFNIDSNGLIMIEENQTTLLDKYKLRYEAGTEETLGGRKKKYEPNSTVRLKINKVEQLYKIEYRPGYYFLYPLNKLEPTEHGLYSINPENNTKKYPNYNFYKQVINAFMADPNKSRDNLSAISTNVDASKFIKEIVKDKQSKKYDKPIDLYTEPLDAFEQHVVDETQKFYKHADNRNEYKPMFIRYNAATKHLHKEGKNNGQKVTLPIKVGDNIVDYPVTMFRVKTNMLKKIQDTYLVENKKNKPISDSHKLYTYLINTSREKNYQALVTKDEKGYLVPIDDIIAVVPDNPNDLDVSNNPNVSFSAISEGRVTDAMDVAGDIYKTVMVSTSTNKDDADAYDTKRYWESNDIKYTTDNVASIIKSGAEYMVKRTEHILEKLKYFYKDSDEVYHALNTETAIDALYDDEELRNSYLQLMLEAKALVRNNQAIANISIDNQDNDIQLYLTKIQRCIRELKNTEIINEAQIMFANRHLAKYSTDPLIRHDVLKVLNAFQETNWFDGWIGDMTETNNSLMQIITKIVTSDIHSKQKLANRLVKEVREKIAKLKKEASDKGQPINWANIIDDATGMFIQNYNEKLREDRDKLKAKAEETELAYNNGTGSFRDYYLAKHEYDMWKAKHINQIADPEYYDKKVALEHRMLFGRKYTQEELRIDPSLSDIPAYDDVFLKYKELSHKRGEIYSHMTNGYLDQVYLDELDKLNKEINNLISETHTDPITGEYKPYREEYDPLFNPLQGTPEQKRIRRMYSGPAQRAIVQYINEAQQLEKDYFQRDTEIGFQEELNKHIKVITHYERRDANGNPTVPMSLLMDKPDYVASKQWIAHNAIYVLDDANREKLNEARKEISRPASRIKFKELVEKREAKDDLGVVDGRVFTDEEIKIIRNEQEGNILFDENTPYNERGLLKNVRPDTTIYTHQFYANMKLEGTSNSDYQRIIGMINTLLQPYWNGATQTIDFRQIPEGDIDCSHFNELRNRNIYNKIFEELDINDVKTGIDLYYTLEKLYEALSHTKRRLNTDSERAKQVSNFISNHTVTVIPDEARVEFDKQAAIAKTKGLNYERAWNAANVMIIDGEAIPNPYIYGRFEPIESEKEKYTDKKKTEAINLVSSTYINVPTEYYYMKLEEMLKLNDKEAFDKWFRMNHIFNPSTGQLDPIRCWTTYTYRDGSTSNGTYNPKWINTRRNVKKDKRNKNYIEDVGHLLNYKVGTGYDNPKINNQTDSEKEFKTYIQDLLYSLVHTDDGRRYLQRGYFPAQSVKEESAGKTAIKEILRTLGWTSHHTGKDTYHDSISYDEDRTISMPLLKLLEQVDPLDAKLIKPVRDENDTDETFAAKEAKYQEDLKALKANNAKAHSAAINHNWEDVLETFIMEACRFNAIQDNKYMLLYGLDTISQMEVYSHKHGSLSSYKKDKLHSTENNPVYQTRKMDNKLYDQVENWIRRILYDEWKEPNGALTKWASRLQSLTSAQYMMMNIKGGIANVSLGSSNILSEAFAKEYIGERAWAKGIGLWHASLMGQLARFDSDTAINETDAIIKWFCVVDYDQHVGKDNKLENPTMKGFRYFNSLMYSPQTIGENYMHNSVLLGMLDEHRIILEQDANGNTVPVFKTLNEYMRDNDRLALLSILSDEQKAEFNQRIEAIKKDANALKDFVWRKNTFINDYIKDLNHNDKKRFEKAKKQFDKDAETRFKANPTVLSELKLGKDGYMTFSNDGFLAKYNLGYEEGKLTPTLKALSDFRNKVISVNKKIHGSYDKLGQAQVEKKWWGSLLMQYHKHIYPGMLKRWRIKGMYNEHRGTVEKGSYISLIQFLNTPIKDIINKSNLTDGEAQAITGIQAIFRKIFDFIQHYKLYWNLLPDYDKANIKRVNGDMAAILVGIIGAMILRGIGDDDDEDTIWYNLALYEVDRLSSEAIQFNPLGMFGEAKKLWSTPIAAQSGVEDLISTMGFIVDWMTDDEFDPIYQTGRFAGQNKILVRIKRRIPIYRGIHTSLFDIKESNRYYKLSENMLGSDIIEDMLEWVEE